MPAHPSHLHSEVAGVPSASPASGSEEGGLKIDLHSHSFFSGDGVSSPEEMIAAAKAKGLNGLALTDHNTCEGIEYLLAKGYMRADGQPVDGFLIIPGVEVSTAEGHLLCLGAMLPNLKGVPALEVCKEIHARGGLAIPAHPYDYFRAGINEETLDTLEIDALEIFNAATTFKRCNERAFEYAQARGLPMTAGSDAHHEAAVGTAYTVVATSDFTVAGVLKQLTGKNPLVTNYLTARDNFRKTWNNWLRILRSRKPPKRESWANQG